jgi:hypothetical protein
MTGHHDYVVIGSLSILGTGDEHELPVEMSMSIDVDAWTKTNPGRIDEVKSALGEARTSDGVRI